jgi:hypothetical protein
VAEWNRIGGLQTCRPVAFRALGPLIQQAQRAKSGICKDQDKEGHARCGFHAPCGCRELAPFDQAAGARAVMWIKPAPAPPR